MCLGGGAPAPAPAPAPIIQQAPPPPPPPPANNPKPPELAPQVTSQKRTSQNEKRKGTQIFRNDLSIPTSTSVGGTPGINIPTK
jgi:hypothetical protein